MRSYSASLARLTTPAGAPAHDPLIPLPGTIIDIRAAAIATEPALLLAPREAGADRAYASAVSWGAIAIGALAAAAASAALLLAGARLGWSAIAPWAQPGAAFPFGAATLLWLILTQALASLAGGTLATGLRARWLARHGAGLTPARDGRHAVLAWAIAMLASAALLASAITSHVVLELPLRTASAGSELPTSGTKALARISLPNSEAAQASAGDAALSLANGAAPWLFAAMLAGAVIALASASYGVPP